MRTREVKIAGGEGVTSGATTSITARSGKTPARIRLSASFFRGLDAGIEFAVCLVAMQGEAPMGTSDVDGLETRFQSAAPAGSGCAQCARERLAGRNYCGTCGTPLRHRCERKQVTVLFADVSGYTSLSERLDPEQVSEIMDEAFAIILDAVHDHRGTVNQFLGDGVMALFGENPGDDHHACRALSAALALEDRLEAVRREVRQRHGLEFRVRVSLNTGPVVVGTIGAALRTDYTAAGNTTGLAARLLGIAAPGQIVVTGRTRQFATGGYDFEELGSTPLTWSSEPVQVFALTRHTIRHAEKSRLPAV
jgi:class 3 adenylate cyclase